MYESPINIIMSDMQTSFDGEIYKAVRRIGIDVHKEELLKALKYDRNQYQKGYDDRNSEIIRCRDCKNHHYDNDGIPYCSAIDYGYGWEDDDYCSQAERRE